MSDADSCHNHTIVEIEPAYDIHLQNQVQELQRQLNTMQAILNTRTSSSSNQIHNANFVQPPKPLKMTSDSAIQWKSWLQHYEWFERATGMYMKDEEMQISTFMTAIGTDWFELYNNFKPNETNNLKRIKQKFSEHFLPKTNTAFETLVFNNIKQDANESFDDFLIRAQTQIKKCEFGNLEDRLLRDKIIIGVYSDKLRENLISESENNLEKVVSLCRASEVTSRQMATMQSLESKVDSMKINKSTKHASENKNDEPFDCKRCGTNHKRRNCPAFGKKCGKCGRFGHFNKQCRTKTNLPDSKNENVNQVNDEANESSDEFFIDSIVDQTREKSWSEIIKVEGHEIKFKLDTGAECNVLPVKYTDHLKNEIIKSTTKRLITYCGNPINVIGEVTCECIVKNRPTKICFRVVNINGTPILGLKTCQSENLIQRISEMKLNVDNEIFKGLGCLKNYEYRIDIKEKATFTIKPTRPIPHAIKQSVKNELDNMVKMDVIRPITEPTPIVSNMVIVKKNGKIRICIDPSDLNKQVLRRHYPLKTVEEVAANVVGSKFFTKLDCTRGFWQIKIAPESQKLLTFGTPWGRYCCKRLPFGLSSASEVFQQIMSSLLKDMPNTECSIDDIFIHAPTIEKLKEITTQVLKIIKNAGLKLNKEKCIFGVSKIKFLGHYFDANGLHPDPEKIEVVQKLNVPKNKLQIQRIMGTVNYLGKFIKNLSEITAPMRMLLQDNVEFQWQSEQQQSFDKIKQILTSTPVLSFYDVNGDVTLQVDASSVAVGAVLMQNGKPVAYASKALSPTQMKYPQIEKEATAIRFACKKFHSYVYGKKLTIQTDHRPLESIFKKDLNAAPPRLQRIMFDVLQYAPKVIYQKGSQIPIADILSRDVSNDEELSEEDIEIQMLIAVSDNALKSFANNSLTDDELNRLSKVVHEGWPKNISQVDEKIKPYWNFRDQISEIDGVLFNGQKLIVPSANRNKILSDLHLGHHGIEKTIKRARTAVFWTGMQNDIIKYIERCKICQSTQKSNTKEPIMTKEIPQLPWEIVASDLFHLDGKEYVGICDSYSGFYTFKKLNGQTSHEVITILKEVFATHGIPRVLESDNGPQYSSKEFKNFANEWNFHHQTSSPKYPRSNGLAEKYVGVAKALINKCSKDNTDIQLALLNQRNTPRNETIGSPAQRLFSRRTNTTLPTTIELLKPKVMDNVTDELSRLRAKQKIYADVGSKIKSSLNVGDRVVMQQGHRKWISAQIIAKAKRPRSYVVKANDGQVYERNSIHLKPSSIETAKEILVIPKQSSIQQRDASDSEQITEHEDNRQTIVLQSNTENTITNANASHDSSVISDPTYMEEYISSTSPNISKSSKLSSNNGPMPTTTRSGRTINQPKRLITEI